jgi:predicted PurR-regulated permease PerM
MRYLAIKSVASLGTGALSAIWLAILGVDYPLLWGLFAFLLNYVPNIGSIIAAVPTVLFTFVQLGPASAAWAALAYTVVNVTVGSIIEPRFMGRGLGLSTLVVFVSLVFWGWILGPVGMFLSVPLTMTAKIALDSDDGTRWMAVLLGPEDALQTAPQESMLADADAEEHDDSGQEPRQEEHG